MLTHCLQTSCSQRGNYTGDRIPQSFLESFLHSLMSSLLYAKSLSIFSMKRTLDKTNIIKALTKLGGIYKKQKVCANDVVITVPSLYMPLVPNDFFEAEIMQKLNALDLFLFSLVDKTRRGLVRKFACTWYHLFRNLTTDVLCDALRSAPFHIIEFVLAFDFGNIAVYQDLTFYMALCRSTRSDEEVQLIMEHPRTGFKTFIQPTVESFPFMKYIYRAVVQSPCVAHARYFFKFRALHVLFMEKIVDSIWPSVVSQPVFLFLREEFRMHRTLDKLRQLDPTWPILTTNIFKCFAVLAAYGLLDASDINYMFSYTHLSGFELMYQHLRSELTLERFCFQVTYGRPQWLAKFLEHKLVTVAQLDAIPGMRGMTEHLIGDLSMYM